MENGLADGATFRLLLATAQLLLIQRQVWQGKTERLYTSTSRIRRSMQVANRSRGFRKCVPGTTTGGEGVLQVPCRWRSPTRPAEVRSGTFDLESRRDSAKLSHCEGQL